MMEDFYRELSSRLCAPLSADMVAPSRVSGLLRRLLGGPPLYQQPSAIP